MRRVARDDRNKERACCVVARPPALDDSGGGRPPRTRPLNTLRSCRYKLATSLRGGVGGRALERHSALGLGSHGRLSRTRHRGSYLLALSSRGSSHPSLPLLDASFYSPATPKASIILQAHCVSHCCRASPRTASLRSTHCIPNTQTPTKRTADALVQQKSAELRANQEAEIHATHGDKIKGESSAFWAVRQCEPLPQKGFVIKVSL